MGLVDDYNFNDVDPELFREMSKSFKNRQREEKKQSILSGDTPSPDKNWDNIFQGTEVIVKSASGPAIHGIVRMAFEKDAYVVENVDGEIVTMDMMRPNLTITSDKPYIFDIMKPNHLYVFLNEKDMEMSEIGFMLQYIKRNQISIGDVLEKTHYLIEKYPEDFI